MLGVVIMVDDSGYGQIIYLVCHAEKSEVLSYRSCLGFRWVITIFQTDYQNPVQKCRNVDKMISKVPSTSMTLSLFSKFLSSRKPS